MTWSKPIELLGFAPDVPPNTLGAFLDSEAVVPTDGGFASGGYPTAQATAMNSAVLSGAVIENVQGAMRFFAGTATKLYEYTGGTCTDRSGATYNALTEPWVFAGYGNTMLACNKNDGLQAAPSVNFAAVANSPKASILIVAGRPQATYVLAMNYQDGAVDRPDCIWFTSDYTNWTPTYAGLGANKDIQLLDTPGRITAAIPFRNGCLVFKRHSVYLGSWVGAPDQWIFERNADAVGCLGKFALCTGEGMAFFADDYGLWYHDGSFPKPIPGSLHEWWAKQVRNFTSADRSQVRAWYDKRRHRVWFGYPGDAGSMVGDPLEWICYNTRSQKWTRYGQFQSATTGSKSSIVLSDEYAVESGDTPHFQTITWGAGETQTAYIRLAAHGDLSVITTLRSLRFLWNSAAGQLYHETAGDWASLSVIYSDQLRKVGTVGVPSGVTAAGVAAGQLRTDDGFDVMQAAKYLSPIVQFPTGSYFETFAYEVDLTSAGTQ